MIGFLVILILALIGAMGFAASNRRDLELERIGHSETRKTLDIENQRVGRLQKELSRSYGETRSEQMKNKNLRQEIEYRKQDHRDLLDQFGPLTRKYFDLEGETMHNQHMCRELVVDPSSPFDAGVPDFSAGRVLQVPVGRYQINHNVHGVFVRGDQRGYFERVIHEMAFKLAKSLLSEKNLVYWRTYRGEGTQVMTASIEVAKTGNTIADLINRIPGLSDEKSKRHEAADHGSY